MLPNEEPLITEIVDDDDDEYIPASVTREEMGNVANNDSQDAVHAESDVEIQEPHIPFTDLDQYDEEANRRKSTEKATTAEEEQQSKDLANTKAGDAAAAKDDHSDFRNIKIKTEPKDDGEDEEDDGFEDVGTVLLTAEELSIASSGKQSILSSFLKLYRPNVELI